MQMRRILSFALMLMGLHSAISQIVINELNVSNVSGTTWNLPPAAPGRGDWVELYNTGTLPEPLGNYYLTNDRTDLFKWHCPSTATLGVNTYSVFWLTGKNTREPAPTKRYHTNFTIEQCKNQWLMLVRSNGTIVDSVYVRRTKADDTRGCYPDGTSTWSVIAQGGTANVTFESANSAVASTNIYRDYAPTPILYTAGGYTPPATPVAGQYDMWIPSVGPGFPINDTVNFQILYTINDCNTSSVAVVPCATQTGCVGPPATYPYNFGTTIISPIGSTQIIRAITIPKTSNTSSTITGTPAYYTYTPTIAQEYLPSFCETNTYFDGPDLNPNPGFGVLSMAIDPTFTTTGSATTVHVEYYDGKRMYSEGYAEVTKPVNDAWGNQQRAFDVRFRDERGRGCQLDGQVFNDATLGTSPRNAFTTFAVKAAGVDNFSAVTPTVSSPPPLTTTHMRDVFANTYGIVNNLHLDGLHYKPLVTFWNGCYMGIYEFREKADWTYVNAYYGHDKDSIDILEQYGAGIINNGSDSAWVSQLPTSVAVSTVGVFNQIRTFPMTTGSPFYDRVMKRFDKASFMDFMIYNSYLVNADLMAYQNSWWRGFTPSIIRKDSATEKWKYFMWDMNDILDLRPPVRSLTATNMSVSPCVYNTAPVLGSTLVTTYSNTASAYTGHGYILYKMLQNADFKNDYVNRFMDLMNTTLRCDKMLAHYNYLKGLFTPEIPNHCTTWNVQQPDWDNAMDTLKRRITQRCGVFEKYFTQCNNLAGPFNITVDVRPAGVGSVDFNSLHLTNFVWSGNYYQNKITPYLYTYLQAQAFDTTAYVFDHWEFSSSTNSTTATPYKVSQTGAITPDSISYVITENDNIVAVFAEKSKDIVMPTGFTPNGDGHNDIFAPLGAAARYARDFEFQVWNRWGQEVFRTTDSAAGWDGRYNGSEAQTGVYAYLIKYKNVLNENRYVKGNVTLVR